MFVPRLVNEPHQDPALWVELINRDHAVLIDCGSLHPLSVGDLQRVRYLCVTHTHIDHFIGFDHLLRMQLFSPQTLEVFGPPGLAEQVGGKLRGYAWNLIDTSPFQIRVTEIHAEGLKTTLFRGATRFAPEERGRSPRPAFIALDEGLRLGAAAVEHGVPCLAFRLEGPAKQTLLVDQLAPLGLTPGPWVKELKAGTLQQLETAEGTLSARQLADRLLRVGPRPSLGYVTDTIWNPATEGALVELLEGVQQLWCEAAFLHEHAHKAIQNSHLTTLQAARLAQLCGAGELLLFHQSRRYNEGNQKHLAQARTVFAQTFDPPRY